MIDVQVVGIVDAIPRSCSCHIFMQIEKYGDVVDSFNNMMVNNLIAEYSEFVVQLYDTYGGPTRKVMICSWELPCRMGCLLAIFSLVV